MDRIEGFNRIDEFMKGMDAKIAAYLAKEFPNSKPDLPLTVEYGSKNAKIIKSDGYGGRSVFCFIDLSNGDILKAASWKAPAKHARGSIMEDDYGVSKVGPYGPAYLRR